MTSIVQTSEIIIDNDELADADADADTEDAEADAEWHRHAILISIFQYIDQHQHPHHILFVFYQELFLTTALSFLGHISREGGVDMI